MVFLFLPSVKRKNSYTVTEAQKKLEYYCAYQERCHKEVTEKLKSMHMIPTAIDHIINHLIIHNYLNEERFAKSFARGKLRVKKWGRQRIIRELKLRDISSFNIKSALKEIDNEDYYVHFHELASKRWEILKNESSQLKKKKFVDYLLYRGWENVLIYDKLNELNK